MKQDYTKIFDLVYKYLLEDIADEIKERYLEGDDIVFIHVAVGKIIRNKYLWGHYEFCKYLASKYNLDCIHPEEISRAIVGQLYSQLKAKADK